ncbi:phosphatidylcholine:diacylglycerol cholinephosphotransferase 1 [Nicotiana tabacum]|uniref:Phosphatidylcholine:diacylglycerol cholinephosphotransferase 1 n=1 Tax=Nicotiana tabacum TaxID=4097 RepID=A0A1S4BS10_TOBAC|nr:PREDICTED: phosphatidylcholine:diacylglycerol cholinephosphotransferase 1-like [Nicotiana tabacum]
MNGDACNGSSPTLSNRRSINGKHNGKEKTEQNGKITEMKKKSSSDLGGYNGWLGNAYFMKWKAEDVFGVVKYHPIPCVFAASLLFFMGVEYTLRMVPSTSPPFDLGFIVTIPLNRLLAAKPALNTLFAGLNTVFVAMQTAYILGTFLIEGRPRATISALFMFTFRGLLGYATQLPLPEDFLGSGVDFPVGNVSFFLFYSGHVAASVIASLDMKRMQRWELARAFDTLNVLQVVRLLSTRGHYTIDLAVGIGAGILFDSMAGKYVETRTKDIAANGTNGTTYGAFHATSPKHENGGVKYQSVSSN